MENFKNWYDKNYKKLLVLPAAILLLSVIYLGFFYIQTGDLINKDVSLTGGTTITIFTQISPQDFENQFSPNFPDIIVRSLSDNTGKQERISITIPGEPEEIKQDLETFLNFKITNENSSTEFTGASLSSEFYKQLIVAVLLAFFWMAGIVFIIFAKGRGLKTKTIFLNILFGFFMGYFFLTINKYLSALIFLAFAFFLIKMYIKNSVPAFAVMLSAFADIVMTLAVVNLFGIKLSTGGIVAFLMLIGYSVDTDILLTTRLLKRKQGINEALLGAFKTGTTMTLTSMVAIAAALIVVFSFESVLNQIFTILLIGLGFDLFNTWITNASIIKWYTESKE